MPSYKLLRFLAPILRYLPYPLHTILRYGDLSFLIPARILDACIRNFEHIFIYRAYTKLQSFEPSESDAVLDAGAAIGFYTVLAATKGARVVALEPNPFLRRYLATNVELNNVRNRVKILGTALASSMGTKSFYIGINQLTSSLDPQHPQFFGGVSRRIVVRTVDLNVLHHVFGPFTLVKLDVECAELDILKSGRDALKSARKVVVEVHTDCTDVAEVVRELELAGFTTVTTLDSEEPYQAIVYALRR